MKLAIHHRHLTETERRAIAMIVMAFDTPIEMHVSARIMHEAGKVAPEMTVADMPAGTWTKRKALERARLLIEQAIAAEMDR